MRQHTAPDGEVQRPRADCNDQDASWRLRTAQSLLTEFDVDENLDWNEVDCIQQIAANARERLEKLDGTSAWKPFSRKEVAVRRKSVPAGDDRHAVLVDSDCVQIVHDLRGTDWDVDATLIEVDESALYSLIHNYKVRLSPVVADALGLRYGRSL